MPDIKLRYSYALSNLMSIFLIEVVSLILSRQPLHMKYRRSSLTWAFARMKLPRRLLLVYAISSDFLYYIYVSIFVWYQKLTCFKSLTIYITNISSFTEHRHTSCQSMANKCLWVSGLERSVWALMSLLTIY